MIYLVANNEKFNVNKLQSSIQPQDTIIEFNTHIHHDSLNQLYNCKRAIFFNHPYEGIEAAMNIIDKFDNIYCYLPGGCLTRELEKRWKHLNRVKTISELHKKSNCVIVPVNVDHAKFSIGTKAMYYFLRDKSNVGNITLCGFTFTGYAGHPFPREHRFALRTIKAHKLNIIT